ncbi:MULTISPECIES: DnaB-like helicase C-terminal domain-containing protein [Geobacillus]|uniref:DnaB-like helicase C-terminal domain-containing protein n=1 Tax=Geobacillus TaxID=129337 RepID=UPI0013FDB893|nr:MULTISPECIES: DnaB-like helicase C-terminal domain-containing protein [Geobacillus]MED4869805.1 DnaB-like helicase C-terminal domain-containing protein [Geobacillus stearothermophilus]MED4987201.1 DnaB-like helicase C-terminal domain-containing protein [Geobacillus stearothermophilus]QNU19915.1 toprim domain-containing protein [Geobacillus thermoleovorans]
MEGKFETIHDMVVELSKNADKVSYYAERGLSEQTIKRHLLGYHPQGFNGIIDLCEELSTLQKNLKYEQYKYIIPCINEKGVAEYFLLRIDNEAKKDPKNKDLMKSLNLPGRPIQFFNWRYVASDEKVIFVTEGAFDALSIEEVGYPSMALNSATHSRRFIECVARHQTALNRLFVFMPDNDEAGKKMGEGVQELALQYGVNALVVYLPEGYKDANEFLLKNRGEFEKFIEMVYERAHAQYLKMQMMLSVSKKLPFFIRKVVENPQKMISTGIKQIDEVMGGGITKGLYVLGGATSVGKTALLLQMADQMLRNGVCVIYVSMEMGADEIIARSIVRNAFQENGEMYNVQDILTGKINKEEVLMYLEQYKGYTKHFYIVESSANSDVSSIRNVVRQLARLHERVVLMVDYLQIMLPPEGKTLSDKQLVDYNVTNLKKISRDFHIPVIAISSFNRSNYMQPVNFESFKESGGVEYSADVVCGLQFSGFSPKKIDEKTKEEFQQLRASDIRKLEFVILKQRNGVGYAKIPLTYRAKYGYFE